MSRCVSSFALSMFTLLSAGCRGEGRREQLVRHPTWEDKQPQLPLYTFPQRHSPSIKHIRREELLANVMWSSGRASGQTQRLAFVRFHWGDPVVDEYVVCVGEHE